ncbi:MAG: hypothetical protein ABIL49_03265 [candidate division WOR-3 bacterium]
MANIIYFSEGNKMLEKEIIRIDADNDSIIIRDFKELILNNKVIFKTSKQDKGQEKLIELFVKSLIEGKDSPIDFQSAYDSTYFTLKAWNIS